MSLGGKLVSLFPLLQILGIAACAYALPQSALVRLGGILFFLYAFPLIAFRLHNWFFPLRRSLSEISAKQYIPWWGAYSIQSLFMAMPWLESWMKTIPGLYSFWLRLWGSRVGKGIFWAPTSRVEDRSLLDIGDNVVVGYDSCFVAHLVKRDPAGELKLFVSPIKVGSGALIGALCRIGPGTQIVENSQVPANTVTYRGARHTCLPEEMQ
ncbi:acyl transferase [bacterium]|nr:acyl transferase [bacterium]